MESLVLWLPKIGSVIVILLGLICLFKPRLILAPMQIEMKSNSAMSEVRAVFGGLNTGTGLAALYLNDPAVYLALGIAWLCVTAARPFSMLVDGTTFKESVPPLIVDLSIAFLFLSSRILA